MRIVVAFAAISLCGNRPSSAQTMSRLSFHANLRRHVISRAALFLSLCLLGFPLRMSQAAGAPPSSPLLGPLEGYWRDVHEPDFLLGVEGAEMSIAFQGRVREAGVILGTGKTGLRVCMIGREEMLDLARRGDQLVFQDVKRGQTRELQRIGQKPDSLSLEMALPDAKPLSEDRIASIQRELRRRSDTEQEHMVRPVRGKPQQDLPWLQTSTGASPPGRENLDLLIAAQTTANTEYLRGLIAEVGWIDVARFGYGASNAAFLLLQHSWDLPLMLAVLPRLKADVDAGLMEKDPYALLYDRIQLARGLRQLYGSQVIKDETGDIVVLPLEEPDQVDARRHELGMIPLRRYVAVFGAPDVKISPACTP